MYGQLPKQLGIYLVDCKEMMFYQYLPIKFVEQTTPNAEERLKCFNEIIGVACCDFIGTYGLDRYVSSYVYLTAKHMFQQKHCSYNRPGYHSDGFMTEDINYIWSNRYGTVFNTSEFILTMDDSGSLLEMEQQAMSENEIVYPDNTLLRLNQYNIHKVADIDVPGMRTFIKLSFSKDKYDLIGNSHNYLFDYNWDMKERKDQRNIPQTIVTL